MAYVYGLRAKDSAEYFYIGSTKHSLEHRFKQHLDMIRLGRNNNRHLVNKVNKIGVGNIIIEPIHTCGEVERFDVEYQTIHEYLANGAKLTNVKLSASDFEIARIRQEYDEFELEPRHIHGFVDAFENGCSRNGDPMADHLADFIEKAATHLFETHFNDFLVTVYEVMVTAYDESEADRQAASVYQRIFAMLERD